MAQIVNGRYENDTKEEILQDLIADAEAEWGQEFTDDESAVVRAHYAPQAERLAALQADLRSVLNAAQVEHAQENALDLIGESRGVARDTATKAVGRVTFQRDTPATGDYTIPAGTIVETNELDPIEFETDIGRTLGVLDDFESANIDGYTGDTASFSTVTTTVHEGSYSLEATATSGVQIINTGVEFGPGSKIHPKIYANASTIPQFLFGVVDSSNFYRVSVDASAGSLELEIVDGGTATSLKSTSITVPTGEWLELVVDWRDGGYIIVTLYDASDTEVDTIEANNVSYTGDELGFGFGSGDANATKYFDMVNMSAVGAPVTAVEPGSLANLGTGALTIMPSPPTGIETAENRQGTERGTDKEEDDNYRDRIKSELGGGSRGTKRGLIEQVEAIEGVVATHVIENDQNSTDADNRPPHSVETVAQTTSDYFDEVAQAIADTKAPGYEDIGGYAGTAQSATAEYTNGQTETINFSTAAEVDINLDIVLTKTEEYSGDEQVQDNVVRYIGGILNDGSDEDGKLDLSDDVIYNQVMQAVIGTGGVYDVSTLEVGTASDPTGTSNVSIADTEIATTNATDGSISVSSSDV